MPNYRFNVKDGISLPDGEGADFADDAAARIEAVRLAGQIIADHPLSIAEGEDWSLDVTDDVGLIVFSLLIFVAIAPVRRS